MSKRFLSRLRTNKRHAVEVGQFIENRPADRTSELQELFPSKAMQNRSNFFLLDIEANKGADPS
jgi:hypothetical protein